MMRLFPNGFGGFDLVEEDGLLGLGGLVGGFFKVICLLFVVAIPPFILGNLPGDLRTLWEADWLDWPALWARTDSIVMFLPLCQVGLLAGLGVSFRRRSVLAGWLTMAVTDYFLCLALNTYTLAGGLDFGSLVTWMESPFLAVLVPLINLAAVTAPLVFLSAPYLAGALLLGLARRLTAPKALKPPRH